MGLIDKSRTSSSSVSEVANGKESYEAYRQKLKDQAAAFKAHQPSDLYSGNESSTADGVVNGDADSVTGSLSDQLNSLVSKNTTNAQAAAVKLPVSDPIKSSFSQKRSKAFGNFITSPTRGSIDDLNIGTTNLSDSEIKKFDAAMLQALSTRLGTELPVNDKQLADLKAKSFQVLASQNIGEVFEDLSTEIPLPEGIDYDAVEQAAREINEFGTYTKQALSKVGQFSEDIVNSIAEGFTAGLSNVTDVAGDLLDGLDISVDQKTLDLIRRVSGAVFGIAENVICGDAVTGHGNRVNLYNGVMNMAASQGMACALLGVITSPNNNLTDYGRKILRDKIDEVSNKGWSQVSAVISEYGNPGMIADQSQILRNLTRDGYDKYNYDAIGDVAETFDLEPLDIYGEGSLYEGDPEIWDAGKLSSSEAGAANSIIGGNLHKLTDRSTPLRIPSYVPGRDNRQIKVMPATKRFPWQ